MPVRRLPLAVLLVVGVTALPAVAGIGAGPAGPPTAVAGAVQSTFVPVRLGSGATENTAVAQDGTHTPLAVQAVDVGRRAAEPTIGILGDGTAFMTAADFDGVVPGAGARTELLRSDDGGLTWRSVQPTAPVVKSTPPANADPYVWVDPRTDRVFNADLVGCGFLQTSDDKGTSWRSSAAACGDSVDHQTIFGGPPSAGLKVPRTGAAAYPNVVYYCTNRVVDSRCGRSFDGGLTWLTTATPAYPGVDPVEGAICNGLHGHGVVDKDGRIFLPKGHCAKPYVAISEDGGDTWTRVKVSSLPAGQAVLPPFSYAGAMQHTSVAVDDSGVVYYVWPDDKLRPWLSVSRDSGRTWETPMMVAPPGVREVNFPTVDAGARGRVAITFVGSKATSPGVLGGGDAKRPWDYHVLVSEDALADKPLFSATTANAPQDPIHRGDCFSRCGGMYDFIDVVVAPSGEVWATAADTCVSTGCRSGAAGPDAGVGRGIAIRQVAGPDLR